MTRLGFIGQVSTIGNLATEQHPTTYTLNPDSVHPLRQSEILNSQCGVFGKLINAQLENGAFFQVPDLTIIAWVLWFLTVFVLVLVSLCLFLLTTWTPRFAYTKVWPLRTKFLCLHSSLVLRALLYDIRPSLSGLSAFLGFLKFVQVPHPGFLQTCWNSEPLPLVIWIKGGRAKVQTQICLNSPCTSLLERGVKVCWCYSQVLLCSPD